MVKSFPNICIAYSLSCKLCRLCNINVYFLTLVNVTFNSLPWNQHTLTGYFAELFYSVVASFIFILVMAVLLLLFISVCGYHCAFYDMYHELLDRWDYSDQNANHQEHLANVIRFHVLIKEYVPFA